MGGDDWKARRERERDEGEKRVEKWEMRRRMRGLERQRQKGEEERLGEEEREEREQREEEGA